MRLGNLLLGLHKAIALHEDKRLAVSVRALCLDLHLIRCPDLAMLAFAEQPETRRHTLLEHFQPHYAMTGVDMLCLVVVVVTPVIMKAGALLPPCLPDHPEGDADDQHGGCDLQIGLTGLGIPFLAEIHPAKGDDPYHGSVGKRGRQSQQNCLGQRATYGDYEGGHHGLGVARFKAVQRAQQDGAGDEQPGIGCSLL
ncbi:hypothetical protein GALL_294420 [mine drainage metagenome]|uniref:Uncharacterized protein n=1 Tax=mine drainage metagenome TaxID=410659 RepID=A0A1J5RGA4_9ZZZZ